MLNEHIEQQESENKLKLENENREMKERINILNDNCLKLQNELKELNLSNQEIKKVHDELKKIQEELSEVKLERDFYCSVSSDAQNFIQENEKFKAQIENLKKDNITLSINLKSDIDKSVIKGESQVNDYASNHDSISEITQKKNRNEKMKEELEILQSQNKLLDSANKDLFEQLAQKNLKINDLEENIIKLTLKTNEALDRAKSDMEQFKADHLVLKQEYNDVNNELETNKKNYETEKIEFEQQLKCYGEIKNNIMKLKIELDNKQEEIEIFKIKLEAFHFNDPIEFQKGKTPSHNQIIKGRFSYGSNILTANYTTKKEEENDLMKKLRSLNDELDEIDKQLNENNKNMISKFDSY